MSKIGLLLLATLVACGNGKEQAKVPEGKLTKIRIDAIKAEIEMPEGTTVKHDAGSGRVHLAKGPLQVNIRPVNKFSLTYKKLSDPTREGVLEVVRADDARDDGPSGFVVVLRTKTDLYPEPRYDVEVRGSLTVIGGGLDRGYVHGDPLFDCGASMPTKELADAVLDACLSLRLAAAGDAVAPASSSSAKSNSAPPLPSEAKPTPAQPAQVTSEATAKPAENPSGEHRPARAEKRQSSSGKPAPKEAARSGAPSVTSTLSRAVIGRVVGRAQGRIAGCYKQGLAKNANLQGRVKTTITVGASGAVSNVSTSGSTLPDREVIACVASVVRTLTFPPPSSGGATTIVYPFDLHP